MEGIKWKKTENKKRELNRGSKKNNAKRFNVRRSTSEHFLKFTAFTPPVLSCSNKVRH